MDVDSPIFIAIRKIVAFLVFPLILIWFSYSHVPNLFTGEFTQQLGSIEVSYIQMAKFIKDTSPAHLWQPTWYLGYPMSLLYTPFVPFVEYFGNVLSGASYSHMYRILTAFAYVLGGVSVYFLGRELLKNTVAGYIAGLIYTVMPSIISLLHSEVATDRFANVIEPRRFTILVRWGEGPHLVSLIFMPLAALGVLRFLRTGNKWSLIFGALMAALTALTNSVGAWGLAMLLAAVVLSEMAVQKSWSVVMLRTLIAGLFSYGFVAFWFTPTFIKTFFREGGSATSFWGNLFPWGFIIIIFIAAIYFIFAKKVLSKIPGLSALLLFTPLIFGFVQIYYQSGSEKIELVPQVLRLTTEVDMAIALLIATAVSIAGKFLEQKKMIYVVVMSFVAVIITGLSLPRQFDLSKQLPKFTLPLESTGKKLTDTPEYLIATEMQKRIVGQERVFMPGNYGFYLNYFTDIPQLRGALYQSSIHPWPDHIYYQVSNGDSPFITRAWLKIANIGWLVYSGPRELFHDYKVGTAKFDDVGTRDGEVDGDIFYKIDLPSTSLAKSVSKEILALKAPTNAIDEAPIYEYEKILDKSNALNYKTIENGRYEISGTIDTESIILVQSAYAPGWSARESSGKAVEVKKDPLGFIALVPTQLGDITVTLSYHTPLIQYAWVGLTLLTMFMTVGIFIFIKGPLIKENPDKTTMENTQLLNDES